MSTRNQDWNVFESSISFTCRKSHLKNLDNNLNLIFRILKKATCSWMPSYLSICSLNCFRVGCSFFTWWWETRHNTQYNTISHRTGLSNTDTDSPTISQKQTHVYPKHKFMLKHTHMVIGKHTLSYIETQTNTEQKRCRFLVQKINTDKPFYDPPLPPSNVDFH